MIAIVVIGMGIDYALFFVRAHQRYGDAGHPYARLVRLAVLMAGTSTLIGFGSLSLANTPGAAMLSTVSCGMEYASLLATGGLRSEERV